jgi:hypothetical protein
MSKELSYALYTQMIISLPLRVLLFVNLDPFPSSEPYEDHDVHISIPPKDDPSCKPVDTEVDSLLLAITIPPCNQLSYVQSKIREGYKPLKLPLILHDYPPNFLDYLPRFNGKDHVTKEQHMDAFQCFTDNFEIIHEDVFMRTFFQSLQGDAQLWFEHLGIDSVSSWNDLHNVFLRCWGKNKSYEQYLSEFYAMKKRRNETMSQV